jgi:hypothetical protein
MRPLRAEASVEIARPVGDVFSALCEARTWPTWTRSASEIKVEPAGPLRGGSVLQVVRRGVGLRRRLTWHVTDLRQDRLVALEDESGSRRFWLQLEPAGDTTDLTARVQMSSGGAFPLLRRREEEARLRGDLRKLKGVLESPAGALSLLAARSAPPESTAPPPASLDGARRGH